MVINNCADNKELVTAAKEAMTFSYSPYSNFKVGAAVLTDTGKIFKGCNIENASYGATICAERNAVFKAVSEGECSIKKIAIVSSSGGRTFPCGICRQVMGEFMDDDSVILLEDKDGIEEYELNELLPYGFDKTML